MKIAKKIWPTFSDLSNYLKDFLLVFIVYFVFAKIGLYVYYEYATSPSLIWPPVGIALAFMYFFGYRIWPAIFLAQFLAVVTQTPGVHLIAFIIAVGYALQAAVGLYVMRRCRFEPSLYKLRNTLIIIMIAFLVTIIEPLIATVAQMYLYQPFPEPLFNPQKFPVACHAFP
ncbi:MAG: MASE1 domain-containing protein [bacterium]|nr:MASE1 domain-containing protein [bacterium]